MPNVHAMRSQKTTSSRELNFKLSPHVRKACNELADAIGEVPNHDTDLTEILKELARGKSETLDSFVGDITTAVYFAATMAADSSNRKVNDALAVLTTTLANSSEQPLGLVSRAKPESRQEKSR